MVVAGKKVLVFGSGISGIGAVKLLEENGADVVLYDVLGDVVCGGFSAGCDMLLRAICYRQEDLDSVVARAIAGGSQGIMQVTQTTPQNQNTRVHDHDHRHHQQ